MDLWSEFFTALHFPRVGDFIYLVLSEISSQHKKIIMKFGKILLIYISINIANGEKRNDKTDSTRCYAMFRNSSFYFGRTLCFFLFHDQIKILTRQIIREKKTEKFALLVKVLPIS